MNIVNAHESRERDRDGDGNARWAEWTEKNPELSEILNSAALSYEAWLKEKYDR
jgi:hypothetical protein